MKREKEREKSSTLSPITKFTESQLLPKDMHFLIIYYVM